MNKPKIELFKDHDGDWSILIINDKEIHMAHSIGPEHILDWLDEHGHIVYTGYNRESGEYTKDGIDINVVDLPKILQDFEDEFPYDQDGY